jgi:hypothetical protein
VLETAQLDLGDRALSDRAKDLYWREHVQRYGPAAGVALAEELRRQVLALRPGWPSPAERDLDHAAHLRVSHALSLVAPRTR